MLLLAQGARRNQDEHAGPIPAAAEGHNMPDANQDRIDQQLGKRVFRCQKLMTELQNVETCLEWVKDELPAVLLLKYAPGLLGLPDLPQDKPPELPQAAAPADVPGRVPRRRPPPAPPGVGAAPDAPLQPPPAPLQPPPAPLQPPPAPLLPSPAHLHEAQEYLQAANTLERFMRKWREQAFGANAILIPRDVARAKCYLTIPEDPWQSFPRGEGSAVDNRCVTFCGRQGYIPGWRGDYAARDWEYIVSHLQQRTAELQRAISAQFRHPEDIF